MKLNTKSAAALALTAALSTGVMAQPGHPEGPGGPGGPHHPPHEQSRVLRLDGSQLQLSRDGGWVHSTRLTPSTVFHRGSQAATAAELAPGVAVHVKDQLGNDGTFTAEDVDLVPAPPLGGKVLSRSQDGLVVNVHGQPVPVTTNDSTSFRYGWIPGSSGGVGEGSHVDVETHLQDGRQVADVVHVHLPWGALLGSLTLASLVGLGVARQRRATSLATKAPYVPGQFD